VGAQASVEDHVLLEKLHTATADKFKELTATAKGLNEDAAGLSAKHKVCAYAPQDSRTAPGYAKRCGWQRLCVHACVCVRACVRA
jgi:hypothetical protein